MQSEFDVAIIGAGPAGSTLAALLARQTSLKILLLEKESMPREHIGESFSHRLIPILAESGALPKVMASECWVRKFGGYYSWDPQRPYATLFEHHAYQRDGIRRWSIHVDRAQFDKILADHAASLGVQVLTETEIVKVQRGAESSTLISRDGREFRARFVVEASGRRRSLVSEQNKAFLSSYKNIAIWLHVLDGKPAQSLPGDWNLFREENLSSIGSFAFEEGWFWYIPVARQIDGKRVVTHSLGLVTDPRVLERTDYREPGRLLALAKTVPLLRDLIEHATPQYEDVRVATNYSMISQRFCSLDERWILIGDSAHFVDPLFSSGVTFAMLYAASAALLLKATLDPSRPREQIRDLWDDYEQDWGLTARSFALAIDQWYHAISNTYPNSLYWRSRAEDEMADDRSRTFHALVNTEFSTDLLHVLTKTTDDIQRLDNNGPLARKIDAIRQDRPAADATIRLRPEVELRESQAVQVVRATVSAQKHDVEQRATRFWQDPDSLNGGDWIYDAPVPCHRLVFRDGGEGLSVRFMNDSDDGLRLYERLREGVNYGQVSAEATPAQQLLLHRIWRAGMLETIQVQAPAA
jgi:flavin-dependent dehydrogenase